MKRPETTNPSLQTSTSNLVCHTKDMPVEEVQLAADNAHDATKDVSLADWTNRINAHLRVGVAALVAAGRELINAKAALKHGGFKKLLNSGELHVDVRTAQMLMRIAQHKVLSNTSNYSLLPPVIGSLNALACIKEDTLQQAITAGQVTASMTIINAKALVKSLTAENVSKDSDSCSNSSAAFNFDSTLRKITKRLDQEIQQCPAHLFPELIQRLSAYLQTLCSQSN